MTINVETDNVWAGQANSEAGQKLNCWAQRVVITGMNSQELTVYPSNHYRVWSHLTSSLMIWMIGQSAPSASVLMTKDWEE